MHEESYLADFSTEGNEEESIYDRVEALVDNGDPEDDDPDAAALAEYEERASTRQIDAEMDPEDRRRLADLKTLKSSTSSPKVADRYAEKISALRAKYE